MKPIALKRIKRADRERLVLMGLIELYLEMGKPIGSNTLKESGFEDLSSATIRNYFAKLEEAGFLHQAHTSGGRVPTSKAFALYAEEHCEMGLLDETDEKALEALKTETKEVTSYLQGAAELISELSGYAVFLSYPRFDQDFVLKIRLMPLDEVRVVAAVVTDFGTVLTEVLTADEPIERPDVLENYFAWRLAGGKKPEGMNHWEMATAQRFYNELMVRYITRHATFSQEEVYRTGFSRLLAYPEFGNAAALASGLALFESPTRMGELLKSSEQELSYFIGDAPVDQHCAVIAIPYCVQGRPVGAIGLLGPTRLPYRRIFGLLRAAADHVGETLAKSLYTFKIQYRQPATDALHLEGQEIRLLNDQRNR